MSAPISYIAAILVALVLTGGPAASAGTLIVLNKSADRASFIDPANGKVLGHADTGKGPHELAVSADGRWAVVSNYGRMFDGNSLSRIDLRAIPPKVSNIDLGDHHRPHGIQWLADGVHVIVTTEKSNSLLLVDVIHERIDARMDTGAEGSHMVMLAPGGKRAYVANAKSGSVSIMDLEHRVRVRIIPAGEGAEGIGVQPDGKVVWVADRDENRINIIDTRTAARIASMDAENAPLRVVFTRDGEHVLVSNAGGDSLSVFSSSTHRREATIHFSSNAVPIGIFLPPMPDIAYVALSRRNQIAVIDLRNFSLLDTWNVGPNPDGMAYTPLQVRFTAD